MDIRIGIDLGGIIWLALLIFGLVGVAGGLVLYKLSRRVGWRAVGMSAAAAGAAALLVLPLTMVGSTDGEAPDPMISAKIIAPQPESSGIVLQGPGPAVGAGMLVPRANNVEELVARSQVIVLGTIDAAAEKNIGPYGADGQPTAAGEDGMPVTDYQVRIENVLKGDGHVEQGPGFVFRMFGHQNSPSGTVSSVAFDHPRVGQRLLFALGTNPDGTYWSGPEGLLNVDGESVSYADGMPFGIEVAPGPFLQKIKQVASLGGANGRIDSVAPLTPGLTQPPVLSGSPLPSLKFDSVDYVYDGYAELSLGEGTVFVIDGTRVKVDDLEVVGTTNEGNTPGIRDGLAVYRLQGAESSEVYTFNPGKDVVNPEDGQVFKGRDSWTRWTESRTPRGS